MAVETKMRALGPGDEIALEQHLQRSWTTSMFLRANARAAGLVDEGQPGQGTYMAAFEGATILGIAAHYWNGVLAIQAQRGLAYVVRMATANTQRPISGILGPWQQVEGAISALGIPPRRRLGGKAQVIMTIDFNRIQTPEAVKKGEAKHRVATAADLERLVAMRLTEKTPDAAQAADARANLRVMLEQQIAAGDVFVAEAAGKLLGMALFELTVPDAVQIGGIHASMNAKGDKSFAAVAVAAAVSAAQARGFKRLVAAVDKTNLHALNSLRAYGFTATADYGQFDIAATTQSDAPALAGA